MRPELGHRLANTSPAIERVSQNSDAVFRSWVPYEEAPVVFAGSRKGLFRFHRRSEYVYLYAEPVALVNRFR